MNESYLTREGHEILRKELETLKTVKRRELSRALAEARAHGDLRENAEYDAAKEAQALNEKRILELEQKLTHARILDEKSIPKGQAFLGATVTLKDMDSGETMQYTLVDAAEADFAKGKISVASPVGKGILGHKANETVEIKIPAGTLKYKILKISR